MPKKEKTILIEVTRPTRASRRGVAIGEQLSAPQDISIADAQTLLRLGKAKPIQQLRKSKAVKSPPEKATVS